MKDFLTLAMLIGVICMTVIGLAYVYPIAQAKADKIRIQANATPSFTTTLPSTPYPTAQPLTCTAGMVNIKQVIFAVLGGTLALSFLALVGILARPILDGRIALDQERERAEKAEKIARILAEMVKERTWLTPEERLALNIYDEALVASRDAPYG